jgi:hypothetical protein
MTLNYLDFDYSEDYDGVGTFDAMASATPSQWLALQAELVQVLSWCHAQFPEGPSPIEEGGDWQYDMQGAEEVSTPLQLEFNPGANRMDRQCGTPAPARTTVSLSISGSAPFCEAFRKAFPA